MRLDASTVRFSPTDLATFTACQHKALLDRLRALGQANPEVYPDPKGRITPTNTGRRVRGGVGAEPPQPVRECAETRSS
jgi:hypothetical protein